MKFKGSPSFSHRQTDKTGVLITNLGTPDAPTARALRRYLKQFLADPRVVEIPRLLWWFILNGIILRIRPRRSAKSYRSVWTEQGSPLLVYTRNQADALREKLKERWGDAVEVEFAMRYGSPSLPSVLDAMFNKGVRKLLVLPLYPQYSASTTASTFDALAADFKTRRWLPALRFIDHYHDFEPFIHAAADRIQQHWREHGRADKLLFTYHGIPKRYLLNGDPYHCQCHKTSRLLAEALGLDNEAYLTTFQSRFGREEWLRPYTDETLKGLPAQGYKSVQLFCPGFAADCLETLEEIGVENKQYFLQTGGERYEYISALNTEPAHIAALDELIRQNLQGWEPGAEDPQREQRAKALGAPF
ncbi:MAG: ferrochelatase [Gammaproteobacteria bacterium HGW-Gammaproteobacteria-3]|nr:MAG: ferrochelatase [Gammaproteobacteria bacterium HGW-Gammaproteobacteria-3]